MDKLTGFSMDIEQTNMDRLHTAFHCLARSITAEDIEVMEDYAPATIICAESSFEDDSALSNAHYILRDKGIDIKLV